MKVTLKDIAERLDISQNTVSKALRDDKGVSLGLRKKILDLSKELGYQKGKQGQSYDKKHALVIVKKERYNELMFWPEIIYGMRQRAEKYNLQIHIETVSTEQENVNEICRKDKLNSYDGIIFLGTFKNKYIKAYQLLHDTILLVDHYLHDLCGDMINIDNKQGIFQSVCYLAKCGHKKIGFIGDITWSQSFLDRYNAFCSAVQELGLELDERYLWTDIEFGEDHVVINHRIDPSKDDVTAFVCANDLTAITLVRDFSSQGIQIPSRISVIGFDDISMCTLIHPMLTTIRVPKADLGCCAIDELIYRLENPTSAKRNTVLATDLIVRESVKSI